MAHEVEGNDDAGYRVVDPEVGPLTGRHKTKEAALKAAKGEAPKKAPAKKAAAKK